MTSPAWGPAGQTVFERTYSRPKANGEKEEWGETVARVVDGNLSLVDQRHIEPGERERLAALMQDFKILPAGRHLWASGVPGRQYLFNCHVSGWDKDRFSTHFEFTFMRLMEGGGVGANYSSRFLTPYRVKRALRVHIVCDPSHPDYQAMKDAGLLSEQYDSDWHGSFEIGDSREGWAEALVDLLDTFTLHDDVKHADRVYDVTNVRPEGSRLKTFGGRASGPLPFARLMLKVGDTLNASHEIDGEITPLDAMDIDHAIGECVVAGGNRRSARMAMVHWKDPYILDFIKCKADPSKHWTTNISVEIDDEFIAALNGDLSGDPVTTEHAYDVHAAVVAGMLSNGEPGYWNHDLSNHGEPVEVICTNPCGEIALTEWENCNLGHVNLDAFVGDFEGALEAHRLMARFLIRATYGDVNDPKQAAVLASQRRIGVGHFGYQGWVTKAGIRYSESWRDLMVRNDLAHFYQAVRTEADRYAFQLRIPAPVKVTTVAPTGSIAKLPGRTEGIHPVFARYFIRRIRYSGVDPEQRDQAIKFFDQGYRVEADLMAPSTWAVEFPTMESLVAEVVARGYKPEIVESADEISLRDMLEVQAMYQELYADNAVSFTVNVRPDKVAEEELASTLAEFLPGLKGTTVFPEISRPQSPYERITREEYEASLHKMVADSVDENCTNGACPIR